MRIGLRTIKTAIAVFLSCNLSMILFKNSMPFYSSVNAILCMQQDIKSTYKESKHVLFGTFLGGLLGTLFILLVTDNFPMMEGPLFYAIISVFIVFIIVMCTGLNMKSCAVASCVAFLNIAINYDSSLSAYFFGMARIAETVLGVVIAYVINLYNPYAKPNKDVLFVTDLDGTLLNSDKSISERSIKIINKQISRGLIFSVATARTPATIANIIKPININVPVVCMNGSVIYDFKDNRYIKYNTLSSEIFNRIQKILNPLEVNKFVYTLKNDHIYVYHSELRNDAKKSFFEERKSLDLKTYINKDIYKPDSDTKIIFVLILDKKNIIDKIYHTLHSSDIAQHVSVTKYKDIYFDDYYYLEIYSKNSSKKSGVEFLKNYTNTNYLVTFGDNENDISMFEVSQKSFAVSNGTNSIKTIATHIIGSNNEESVANTIRNFRI